MWQRVPPSSVPRADSADAAGSAGVLCLATLPCQLVPSLASHWGRWEGHYPGESASHKKGGDKNLMLLGMTLTAAG